MTAVKVQRGQMSQWSRSRVLWVKVKYVKNTICFVYLKCVDFRSKFMWVKVKGHMGEGQIGVPNEGSIKSFKKILKVKYGINFNYRHPYAFKCNTVNQLHFAAIKFCGSPKFSNTRFTTMPVTPLIMVRF